jgi:hypothetical protein
VASELRVRKYATGHAALRWAESAANTRKMTAEGPTRATLAFLDSKKATRNHPDDRTLRSYAFNPPTWQRPVPTEVATALEWVAAASRPVSDLREPGAPVPPRQSSRLLPRRS